MDIGIFKKLHAAQLKCRVKLFALILSYLEVATHYLPLHQIFIFQYTLIYPIYPPPCRFNTATRRWLVAALNQAQTAVQFQHAAARRRLQRVFIAAAVVHIVSTHSHPKVAGGQQNKQQSGMMVSTHSRPKAAGNHAAPV